MSGSGEGQAQGAEGQNNDDQGQGQGEQPTLTQADVDRIVAARLSRAEKKYADYDELKEKAARLDQLEEQAKSELERERDRADKAERRAQEATARAERTIIRSEIAIQAANAGAIDVGDVVALLSESADITVDKDGKVQGAEAAVKAMAKAKPHLFKSGAGGDGFEQGARRGGGEAPSVARGRELYEQSRKKR